MVNMRYHLYDLIEQKTGKTRNEFCKTELSCSYQSFHHRYVKGKIHLSDYFKISQLTGMSLDELIMKDPIYQDLGAEIPKVIKENSSPPPPKEEPKEDEEEVFKFIPTP